MLAAGDGEVRASREALTALCRIYWYPLYAYARRRTENAHDAEDVTQEFFTRLLETNLIARATPDRGRFRSFLLTSFRNFLANEWNKGRADKRGGGRKLLSLDLDTAESRYRQDVSPGLSPDQLFDRQWALSVLDQVLERLREESASAGRRDFEILKQFLSGAPADLGYADAARLLGKSENATRVAVHRLRLKYREFLREEIARTVDDPADVDREIRLLFSSFP